MGKEWLQGLTTREKEVKNSIREGKIRELMQERRKK